MRVFVFEFITGGGCAGRNIVSSLMTEGDMMLAAVTRDLLAIEGIEVITTRDRRLDSIPWPIQIEWVDGEWEPAWLACMQQADAVLPIAPETDGVLERLCRDVEASGKLLLNSSADAVAAAGSKQTTIECLAAAGVPVVSSWRADRLPPLDIDAVVVKPDRGVACQGIHALVGQRALSDFIATRQVPADWLVQPYLEGQAVSLSLMVGRDSFCLLGRNVQRIAQVDDSFVLLGCVVNGWTAADADELVGLAQQVSRAIPGLWGYVGVDLLVGEDGPVVLEVNPRLTTSYVGLSQSIGINVAGLMLHLDDDPLGLPGQLPQGSSVHIDLGHSCHVA